MNTPSDFKASSDNWITRISSTLAILWSQYRVMRTGHRVRPVGVPYSTIYRGKSKKADGRIGIGAAIILLVALGTGNLAAAQQPYRWAPDQQVPDYLDDTFTPFLLADQNRTVHAFASQWVGDEDKRLAIFYRQWSLDGGWTTPVDILLSPVGRAQILSAFLDQTGTMHLVFWGGEAQAADIYYTRAPAVNAGQAPSGSVLVIVA